MYNKRRFMSCSEHCSLNIYTDHTDIQYIYLYGLCTVGQFFLLNFEEKEILIFLNQKIDHH